MNRDLIKNFFPLFLLRFAKKVLLGFELASVYFNRIKQELKYTSTFCNSIETMLFELNIASHILEKGITMPNRRLGFGLQRVEDVIKRVDTLVRLGKSDAPEVHAAVRDLKQYLEIHKAENFSIPLNISQDIEHLIELINLKEGTNCYKDTFENMFADSNNFAEFSAKRHSVRWFSSKPVSEEILTKAIALAQNAPSACNRQSIHVKVINDKKIKDIICKKIQTGNRGFGHLANKWILLTSDLRAWGYQETNMAYIDTGIFAMNLLYSLHYYGIAACTLNANLSYKKQKMLRKILELEPSEIPVLFIAIGITPKEFMVCKSNRVPLDQITKFI